MIAAPAAAISSACASAARASRYSPPSENESGVTLRTPMTMGRSSSVISRTLERKGARAGPARAPLLRSAGHAELLQHPGHVEVVVRLLDLVALDVEDLGGLDGDMAIRRRELAAGRRERARLRA